MSNQNTGTTIANSLTAPPGELNAMRFDDVQTIANNDLYSVLANTTSEALKPDDVLGQGELKGIVIGIVNTHKSLQDIEVLKKENRKSPPDKEDAKKFLDDGGSNPYGYIVNIPELCFMLPTPPSTSDSNYTKILKAYRDTGFVFRVRNDQAHALASVGDIVKVGFQNRNTFTGGYFVGRMSAPGSFPSGPPSAPNSSKNAATGGTPSSKTAPVIPGKNRQDVTYQNKQDYISRVTAAQDEVLKFKCSGKLSRPQLSVGKARLKAYGGFSWYNDGLATNMDFFGPFRRNPIVINKNAESAFKLVRNAMAQDDQIMRYMAESILYIPTARLSHLRKTCGGYKVKTCPGSFPVKKDNKCYNAKGTKYSTTPDWNAGGDNCFKDLGNHGLGVGLDINPTENPYSYDFKTDHPPQLQAIFKNFGFRLGTEFGKADTMHFDYVGDPAEANALWAQCINANESMYYEENWVQAGGASAVAATDGKAPSPRAQQVLQNVDPKAGAEAIAEAEKIVAEQNKQAEEAAAAKSGGSSGTSPGNSASQTFAPKMKGNKL
jgi:hypothetical protein